jgi:hypothetical protein
MCGHSERSGFWDETPTFSLKTVLGCREEGKVDVEAKLVEGDGEE